MIKKLFRLLFWLNNTIRWRYTRWPKVWWRSFRLKIVARECGKSPYVGGKCTFGGNIYLGDYCNFNGMQMIGGGIFI